MGSSMKKVVVKDSQCFLFFRLGESKSCTTTILRVPQVGHEMPLVGAIELHNVNVNA